MHRMITTIRNTSPSEHPSLQLARAVLMCHPLRDGGFESRIEQWLATVGQVDPLRAEWHAKRTYGFGGSEYGALVQNYRGEPDEFSSARRIVASKLLLSAPSAAEPAMQRGIDLEPFIRDKFHSQYGVKTDQVAFDKLAQAIGPLAYMRYSPDDVVIARPSLFPDLPNPLGKQFVRLLVDYKAPGEIELEDGLASVKFGYRCQLHGGRLIAETNDIAIDGMILVQWDLKQWKTAVSVVPYQNELSDEIIDACRYYREKFWERGALPPYPKTANVLSLDLLAGEDRENLNRASVWYSEIDTAIKILTESKQQARNALEDILARRVFDEKSKLKLTGLDFSINPVLDEDLALAALKPRMDVSTLYTQTGDYNVHDLVAFLSVIGHDAECFRKQVISGDALLDALEEHDIDVHKCTKYETRVRIDPKYAAKLDTRTRLETVLSLELPHNEEKENEQDNPASMR